MSTIASYADTEKSTETLAESIPTTNRKPDELGVVLGKPHMIRLRFIKVPGGGAFLM